MTNERRFIVGNRITNRCMKKICSTVLVTGEMQFKTSRRNDSTPQEWQKPTGRQSWTSWKMHVTGASDASLAEAVQSGQLRHNGFWQHLLNCGRWRALQPSSVLLDLYLRGTQKPCSQAETGEDGSTVGLFTRWTNQTWWSRCLMVEEPVNTLWCLPVEMGSSPTQQVRNWICRSGCG